MNTLEYSKAQISRAKTSDYLPGQSASGPFYNPNLAYSNNLGQTLPTSQVYSGDASRYYAGSRHPIQSYEQYGYRLANSYQNVPINSNHHIADSHHVSFRVPQSSQYQQASPTYSHHQLPTYYNDQARYLVQNQGSSPYQREFLSFRPMMANEINQVPQSRIPISQRTSEPFHEYDFKVFCPACHQEYYNSQVEEHIERHYLYNTDQFKVSTSLDETHVHEQVIQPLGGTTRFIYPLVEPQEFQCKELDEVNYMNKYKLHHEEMNKKQSNVKVKSQSTQFAKPPLQIRSENTDIYNCFDNIFNSKNEFSVNDITKNNTILAKKRELEDWEKLRSQKEGYSINKK